MTETRLALAGNVLGNQAVWLCAVAGAARGSWWPAVLAALAYCSWQWALSNTRGADARLVVAALVAGCLIDGALAAAGWLAYAAAWPSAAFAPVWILALWAAFAMMPMHALAWLQPRPALAFVLGAVGGPLAYWGAARGFGAVAVTGPPLATWAVLALAWGVAIVALMGLAARASGAASRAPNNPLAKKGATA